MDEARRAAWQSAIAKQADGDDVPPEEHYALFREGMFAGETNPAVMEEADLFLRYWLDGLELEPLPWIGPIIADHWFRMREWDRRWGRTRADVALREYIATEDHDHWIALHAIAARLHRQREPFPEALAVWAVQVHEGALRPPPKERGNDGDPPYAHEDRNGVFTMADNWLEHFGMALAKDRRAVIAGFADVDEEVVRRGLLRARSGNWRRAPWPRWPRG